MDDETESEIDAVISAFYAAFDNRGARLPAVAALRAMFLPDARVTRVSAARVESWSIDEFIAPRAAMLTDGTLLDFHEWETSGKTTVFAGIANRESHYRKAGVLNGTPYAGEGRKFIQLCRNGERWLIVAVLWEDLSTQLAGG